MGKKKGTPGMVVWTWIPLAVLGLLMTAVLIFMKISEYQVFIGIVEPREFIPLIAQQTGIIKHSKIVEGNIVNKGELLLQLDSNQDESTLKLLVQEKTSSERILEYLNRELELQNDQTELISRNAEYRKSLNHKLKDNNSVSLYDFSQSMYAIERELLEVEKARLELDTEIEDLRDTIESTRILIEHQKDSLKNYSYSAPADGTIVLVDTVYRAPESLNFFSLQPVPGLFVTKGTLLGYIVKKNTLTAKITIPERKIHKLRTGNHVRLLFSALPDSRKLDVQGKLESISSAANNGTFIGIISIGSNSKKGNPLPAASLLGTTVEARIHLGRSTFSQKISSFLGK